MRAIIFVLLILFAPLAFAENRTATNSSGDTVTVTDGPCAPEVLNHIPQGSRGYFRGAAAIVDGKSFLACWVKRPDGLVFLIYEDGDAGLIPMGEFKPMI